jgi:UDP-glucose 4-epimerase
MKIVLTGISSFTGLHFLRALTKKGHKVIGVHQSPVEQYQGIYKQRLGLALPLLHQSVEASFGDDRFCGFISKNNFDVYCHHGAYTKEYTSPNFSIERAVQANTYNLSTVSDLLEENTCHSIVSTSSIFAGHGPVCSSETPFSGYGESKWKTDQLLQQACIKKQLRWARFIIPNPFGPLDNHKLPFEMALRWSKGKPLVLKNPEYVRDNIPVQLLAKHYANWIESLSQNSMNITSMPSGYVSTMKVFSERVAKEIRGRTGWGCKIESNEQHYSQPLTLHNRESLLHLYDYDEEKMWNALYQWFIDVAGANNRSI